MTTLLTAIQVFINIMILALIMKMTVRAREFFFNPILRPVDVLTEPILKYVKKFVRPTSTGWDYSPLVCILLLILSQSLIIGLLSEHAVVASILISIESNIRFLLQVMTICFIIALVISEYISNPLARFLTSILKPFEYVFAFPFKDRNVRLIATYLGFFILIIFVMHGSESLYHELMTAPASQDNILQNIQQRVHIDFLEGLTSWQMLLYSTIAVIRTAVASLNFLSVVILLNAILSWMNLDARHPIPQFIYAISEPILTPIRRSIPSFGAIDLSPVICIFLILILTRLTNQMLVFIMVKALNG